MDARGLAVTTALMALLLALPATGHAATFVVTDTADGAPVPADCPDGGGGTTCSLRDAISAANDNFVEDTIELEAGETYSLSHDDPGAEGANAEGDLDVSGTNGDLTIAGNGATIAGLGTTATERVLQLNGTSLRRFEIRDLTITGGRATVLSHGPGAGIAVAGKVLLERVSITGNTMESSASSQGGGLSSDSGDVELRDSLVSGNTSSSLGGGIIVTNSELTLANTTVTGNNASAPGGGVYVFDGASLHLRNATVVRNASNADGGNVFRAPGSSGTAVNSIVALPTSAGNCQMNLQSWAAPVGGNVSSTVDTGTDGCRFGGTSKVAANPLLGPLAANGGPSQTIALLTGSPARDAGTTALGLCPATDQRGQARPRDGDGDGSAGCDAGAYEAAAVPLKPKPRPTTPRPPGTPPPGPGVVPDTTDPTLRLRRAARQAPLRRRNTIVLKVASTEDGTITARGSVRVPGRRRPFAFEPVRRTVTAGRTITVKMLIPRRALARVKRSLRRGRRLRATFALTATDEAGNTAVRRTRVTLIP